MTPNNTIRAREIRQRFSELVGKPGGLMNLAKAALLVAAEEETHIDVAHYLALLDELGEAGALRVSSAPGAGIEAFNDFLFAEKGFKGNQAHYYDPRNSFLTDVLDRRVGIPITLSIVYMEVGRRAGLETEGVGMPGHFIVRAREKDAVDAALVDPFSARTIDRDDCQARLDELFEGNVTLSDEHLRAANAREVLVRLLTNLKAIYTQAGLYRQALATVERILLIAPESPGEHRDRGELLAQLDRLPEAIWETQLYVQIAERAEDVEQVKEQLHIMQRRMAMRN